MKEKLHSIFGQYSKTKKIILSLCIVMLIFSMGTNFFLLYTMLEEPEEAEEEVVTVNRLDELTLNTSNYLSDSIVPEVALTITDNALESDTWAFAIIDLETGTMASWNSHPMCSASIIKQYIMATMYEHWDELCENYDESYLKTQMKGMIVMSDNGNANTCINMLGLGDTQAGIDKVNAFTKKFGYNQTRLDHPFYSEGSPEIDNLTSAIDNALFQYDIMNNRFEHSQDMLELLKNQYWTHKIPSGIPKGIETANKTGDLWNCENDCAIVWGNNGTYILSIMSDGLANYRNARAVITKISTLVYNYFDTLDRTTIPDDSGNIDAMKNIEPFMHVQASES